MNLRPVSIAAAVALALFAVAVPVSAQQQVVDTNLKLTADPWPGLRERNETNVSGFVGVEFCYGQGGLNPQNGKITITPAAENLQDWFELEALAPFEYQPPTGPEPAATCKEVTNLEVRITRVLAHMPYEHTHDVTFKFTVTGAGIGTYKTPGEATATLTVNTGAAPVLEGPDFGEGPAPTPTPTSEPAGESPLAAPTFLLVALAALVGVVLRRRA